MTLPATGEVPVALLGISECKQSGGMSSTTLCKQGGGVSSATWCKQDGGVSSVTRCKQTGGVSSAQGLHWFRLSVLCTEFGIF